MVFNTANIVIFFESLEAMLALKHERVGKIVTVMILEAVKIGKE